MTRTRSSASLIPPSGQPSSNSAAGSPDSCRAGSSAPRGHRQANAKLAALDRRAVNLRRESIHTLTTSLARRYGTVVIEDPDIAAMGRGIGRRAFRRSLYQAGLGRVRPTLAYKCAWGGGELVVADRWFASSKSHWYGGVTRPTSPSWSSAT